jgi:DNA-directed RNA polymerase specialized sigma24 family protein
VTEEEQLAAEFETQRPYLHAIAFRMLGSHADADDAVQEAWLRLARTGGGGIEDLRGWLTTVTGRICLDALRRRGVSSRLSSASGCTRGDPRADRPGPAGPGRPLVGRLTGSPAAPSHELDCALPDPGRAL